MRLRPIILGLIATAAACGGGSLNDGGTAGASGTGTGGVGGMAGTTGVGGMAGTTGVGGMADTTDVGCNFLVGAAGARWSCPTGSTGGVSAGSGGAIAGSSGTGTGGAGPLPACGGSGGGSADIVELAIVGPDGMTVTSTVSASVRVTAADACSTVSCPSISEAGPNFPGSLSAAATRFVLTAADARTWTLYLRNSAMPGDYLKVNDSFDMTVQADIVPAFFYASLNQTIVLAHGTDVALFASALSGYGIPPLPALDAFGIAVTDAGARCEMPPFAYCLVHQHAAHVTIGTDSLDVARGTAQIGWLSFTNGGFLERNGGNCDRKGATTVAGFRTP